MSSRLLLETTLLFSARLALLLGCRKYLLRTLYSDLKSLSSNSATSDGLSGSHRRSEDEIEMNSLPLPSTHTPKSAGSASDVTFIHAILSRTLFSWAFAESCMMFLLLVFQGMDLFTPRTRLLNWQFSLFFLVATILVVIPASVSLLLALGNAETFSVRHLCGPRALLNFIPVGFYFFALSYIPLPAALATTDRTTAILCRLIVLGTVILGALSGFGAISNAWPFIPFLSKTQSVPSENDIRVAEHALASVRDDLSQRRLAAERRAGTEPQGSWFSRVGASFRGGDGLSQEVNGLEALEYQMTRNVDSLRQRRDAALYSATFKGRIAHFVGRVFALYCISRILSALYNVAFLPSQRSSSNVNYSDLLSNILAHGLSQMHMISPASSSIGIEDVATFSRQLSLALVGVIIVTSIRYVLRGVTRVLQITSRSLGASLMLLFLAQVMAIYLLSTVVQMRSSFPPPPSPQLPIPADEQRNNHSGGTVTNLFATIPEYELFGSLFDWTFLLTAAASGFVRWGAEKVNGVGDD